MDQIIYTQLHENLRGFVSTYYSWYAFFWTLNLGALAWIYAKPQDLPTHVKVNRTDVALLFVFLNFLATLSGLLMIPAIQPLVRGLDSIGELFLVRAAQDGVEVKLAMIARAARVPAWVLYSSFGMCAASTVAIGCWWLKMYRHDK